MTPQKDNFVQIKRLSNETDYFNNVFKRTEKIISVIFYILSHIDYKKDNEEYVQIVKDRALKTHEVSLQTLQIQSHNLSEQLRLFMHALVSLESTLRVAEAAGVIPQNLNHLLFEQLIGVERYVTNHYLKEDGLYVADAATMLEARARGSAPYGSARSAQPRRKTVQIPKGDISSDAYLVYSKLTDRAERIRTVLEAKPQATIKDISDIITDVSEKTIQRELNSLIEKGQVIREGERRWSRYSVKK